MHLTCRRPPCAVAPANLPLDGIDILRHLEEGRPDQPRTLFWRIRRETSVRKAVRDGNMKYVFDFRGEGAAAEHVFDLATDVAEKNDLSKARPRELAR